MASPENEQVEASVGDDDDATGSTRARARARARSRGRTAATVSVLVVLVVAGVVVAGVVVAGVAVGRSPVAAPALSPIATTRVPLGSAPSIGTAAPTPVPTPSAARTVSPPAKKITPPAMSAEQYARTRTELTALAVRLPAALRLTAPASWAPYAGRTPEYRDDIVSCPHIAARLGADLGARWTYTFGKLPTGPGGCFWTPVPWIPDVSRFFVSIGYQTGDVPSLMHGMDSCAGGVEAPRLNVPAVGRGAVLYGCDDANGAGYDLAVPDTGGTGVFFLSASGGAHQSPAQVADAMRAVIDGAGHAYA
ncbi:MAG TPA: hypothetical protein VGN47_13870 [Blastococcus sp.]|nr:hypothetical protein [Blastococcus sp.]